MALKDIIRVDDNHNQSSLTDFELGVLFERTRSAHSRMRELELAQYGLTPEQAAILHTLQSKGGSTTIEELANTIIRQYHSVASIVNRMVKIGLVKKRKIEHRKKSTVFITEKGEKIYNQAPNKSLRIILEGLSAEEKQQFGVTLQKLLSNGRRGLDLDHRMPFLSENPINNGFYDKGDDSE